MFSAHYSYKCSCKQDPQHGSLRLDKTRAELMLGFLDRAWEEAHNRPGCTPAAEARTLTHRGKKPAPAGG